MFFWQAKSTLSGRRFTTGSLNAISLSLSHSWYWSVFVVMFLLRLVWSVFVVMFLLRLVSLLRWGLLNVSMFCSFKLRVPFFYNQLWLTFTWITAVIWLHFLWRGSLNRVWYSQTCQTVWAITFTFWAVYLQFRLKLLFHSSRLYLHLNCF